MLKKLYRLKIKPEIYWHFNFWNRLICGFRAFHITLSPYRSHPTIFTGTFQSV